MIRRFSTVSACLVTDLFADIAGAHPGHWPHGTTDGSLPTITGIDHILIGLVIGAVGMFVLHRLGRRPAAHRVRKD